MTALRNLLKYDLWPLSDFLFLFLLSLMMSMGDHIISEKIAVWNLDDWVLRD